MNRRRVLVGLTAGLSSLAGCGTYFDIDGNDTATRSPTTTVTETARTTASNTPVPTATATPPSAADTWPTGTVTEGETAPDFSTRETYTNDRYAYTIEYPMGWVVDATDPTAVTIGSNVGALVVEVMEDVPSSLTVSDIVPVFIEGYKESIEEDGGTIEELDRKDETLSNGHDAMMIDLRMEQNATVLQQKILLTVANEIAYVAVIVVSDSVYTAAVEGNMETILLTLSITESTIKTESAGVPV
ncbi:hypothetical protein [Halocatena salina]|uniref:Uncharacterized protein n=1 Tax=Halocatena salina TaxID=2934340 RepID=A0A8U0A4N1_9EURY|nr:hypothetical protein [Halocatena salina]UPM43428.1 hypothetical protein MW046_03030 [Halocatena salina]